MKKIQPEFWIAACDPRGGAYRYAVSEGGAVRQLQHIPMDCPMYLALSGGRLLALLRAPFPGSDESGLCAYDPSNGAALMAPVSTRGVVACHLAVAGEDIYCANYVSGSLIRLPAGALAEHTGRGVDPARQEAPHVHSVLLSPDCAYVLSCDLGLDTVFVYDRALREVSRACVPAGHGARHLVFSRDGAYVYCVNEMGSSVTVFAWQAGRLTPLNTVSVLPEGYTGANKAAAIRLREDGRQMYVTNRGANTVTRLAVDGASLRVLDHTDTRGDEPRDFLLLRGGEWAVCTNQFGNSVVLWHVEEDGGLTFARQWSLPAPLCVIDADPAEHADNEQDNYNI